MLKRFFKGYFKILQGELIAWVILLGVTAIIQIVVSIF